MFRDREFTGIAHGIAREILAINLAQPFQHFRRTPRRVLVKVETQALPVPQRGMIFLQSAYGLAGLKHERTSREWNRHAPSNPQSQPERQWILRFGSSLAKTTPAQ